MLRVLVEMVPGGDEKRKRSLATFQISNRSNLMPISDYLVELVEHETGCSAKVLVTNHCRDHGWKALLLRALYLLSPKPKAKP